MHIWVLFVAFRDAGFQHVMGVDNSTSMLAVARVKLSGLSPDALVSSARLPPSMQLDCAVANTGERRLP